MGRFSLMMTLAVGREIEVADAAARVDPSRRLLAGEQVCAC